MVGQSRGNGAKKLASPQSVNFAVKSICDVTRCNTCPS
jgi:hypothetical protein